MSKTIIFLDFDGVLCDSVKEAYILTRYAYSDIDVNQPIESDKYEKFKASRHLISNSPQYYYLFKAIEENSSNVETRFSTFLSKINVEEAKQFNERFLSKRKELIENNFEFWNSLETPTSFLTKLKNIIINLPNCTFSVLSTKNKEAIIKKFNFWGLDFNQNFIFDKKDLENITKGEFIKNYLNSNKAYKNAILIDDCESNIQSCANIENVKAYFTNWGYIKNTKNAKSEEEILKIIKECQ